MEMTHIAIIIVYFTYLPTLCVDVRSTNSIEFRNDSLARTSNLQSIRAVFLPKVVLLSDQATRRLELTIRYQNVLLDR